MSYDITLKDPVTHEVIEFDEPHQMKGGMYAIGGTKEAWLNITYNYANYYYDAAEGDDRFFGKLWYDEPKNLGIRGIYGKTGAELKPSVGIYTYNGNPSLIFIALMQNRKKTRMTMSDLIDREKFIYTLIFSEKTKSIFVKDLRSVIEVANEMPSAEPEREAIDTHGKIYKFGSCGVCGAPVIKGDKYCSECGVKLD